MKRVILSFFLAAGCSDQFVETAENGYSGRKATTLTEAASAARDLSDKYVDAGRKTRTLQDVASFVVFASAYSVVTGAVGTASDAALAKRALIGAGTQQGAVRLAPRTAIAGIFQGARRLNCVATAAAMGADLDLPPGEREAAVAATIGSIDHIRILTREGLIRDVADFNGLLTSLSDAAKKAADTNGVFREQVLTPTQPKLVIDQYLQLLANCTAQDATTVQTGIPKPH